jgi:hypothetical protein
LPYIGEKRKVMASMIMLVSWEIWKECNTRVFKTIDLPWPWLLLELKMRQECGVLTEQIFEQCM